MMIALGKPAMFFTPRAALSLALGLITCLGSVPSANADQMFPFLYAIPSTDSSHPTPASAIGTLTTTELSDGVYSITGISGVWNGYTITGLLDPGAFGDNDNLLFTSGPGVDDDGFAFTVDGPGDDGSGQVDFYYKNNGYTELSDDIGYTETLLLSAWTYSYFDFNYSFPGLGRHGTPVSANGTLTTVETDPGTYLVVGIDGTWNGQSISQLEPVNSLFGGNDNILYSDSPYLTDSGITFKVPSGGDDGTGDVNVYYNTAQDLYTEDSHNVGDGHFNIAVTPEPASGRLFGLSVLAACLGNRRRLTGLIRRR